MSKARDLANAGTALTTVSATELGYLDGVTSAIQTQINATTSTANAAVPSAIVDAKGDLIAATAADTVSRLAVGTNGTVLVADSAEATGMKWAVPSSGGMTLISETVASALSSLSFSSIPQTYKQLLLIWSGIQHSTTGTSFDLRLNNDSGTNYSIQMLTYYGAGSGVVTNDSWTSVGNGNNQPIFGEQTNSSSLSYQGQGRILIDNYTSTTKFKTVTGSYARPYGTDIYGTGVLNLNYKSTSAITSIDIFRAAGTATFSNSTNTSIRLYGVS